MSRINPLISTSVMPEKRLEAERRLLRRTMYGMTDMVRVDLDGENLVYTLNTSGKTFTTAKEAFDEAGKTGMTTFARLTGDIETSSYNTRGLAGLEERLKSITEQLNVDTGLANRLGIEDPNLIRFEVGTFKTDIGNKETIKSVISNLEDELGKTYGVMVPDDNAFNLLRVFSGDRELTVGEISRLFNATSGGLGGILSTDELISNLAKGPEAVAKQYSKSGKRIRGAIGLRDLSLAGQDLSSLLQEVSDTTRLDTKSVRIFKIGDDLKEMAANYLQVISSDDYLRFTDPSGARNYAERQVMGLFAGGDEALEKQAYYFKSGAMDQVIGSLKSIGVLNEDGTVARSNAFIDGAEGALTENELKILTDKFKAGFDGTGVTNARFFNATRSLIQRELEALTSLPEAQRSQEVVARRISDLTSQLDKMEGDLFETITGRIFMNVEEEGRLVPKMAKLVTGQAEFTGPLSTYSMLIPDVALKEETSIMGRVNSVNLVLQGEPSPRVYADPLAPAFHYNALSDPDYIRANELKTNRILASLNHAIETGEIKGNLRRQIYQSAEANLELISEGGRSSAERNRMFMRQLKEAIESGMDIRTMPQLLNYLKKNAAADLFKYKDGVGYLPALEDSFRLALDTEASFFAGKERKAARLGEGLTDITIQGMREGESIKALTFQIQGHKMLFAGDTASIFKHSLGGFDLDDKGIVMPRIFEDASGGKRLGTFIFRQPTGPGEFIFGKADLRNIDTIKLFLANNDALMEELDTMKAKISGNQLLDTIHEAMNTNRGRRFDQLDTIIGQQSSDQIENFIINLMESAESRGTYRAQRINMGHSVFQQMEGKEFTSPIALTRDKIAALAEAGLTSEKYLVDQYNYGNMVRIFATEGSFKFSDQLHEGLRGYTTAEQYETLTRLRASSDDASALTYSRAVSELMQGSEEARVGISALFDEDLARVGREKVFSGDTIGQYINRLTVAAAGADQQEEILTRLQGRVDNRILNSLRDTRIATFAPSDVVDLVTNLNKGIGVEDVGRLEALYGSATDQEAAAKAILKITSQINENAGISAVEAAGRQMIQTKFELLGKLRSVSMQNLVGEDDYQNLLAGIDNAILNERLKRR